MTNWNGARRAMKRKILLLIAAITFSSVVPAHADFSIVTTVPKAGTALSVAPNVVSITTSGPLLDQGNSIVVNDPNGVEVDDGSIAVDGSSIIVGMKPLATTGVYTVTYNLVAQDNTPLNGNFTFMFNSPGAISVPSAAPSKNSNTKSNNANNATSNAFVYFLIFLAALVAIFLVWYARATFGGKPKSRKPLKKAVKRAPKKE